MVQLLGSLLDLDSLKKGDYISAPMLEDLTGLPAGTPEYVFAVLGLKAELERTILQRNHRRVTMKSEGAGLRILTDSEAADYNIAQIDQSKRRLVRAHRRNLDVDEGQLTAPERQAHYRNLEVGGKYVQALQGADKDLRPTAHKRQTPGLTPNT